MSIFFFHVFMYTAKKYNLIHINVHNTYLGHDRRGLTTPLIKNFPQYGELSAVNFARIFFITLHIYIAPGKEQTTSRAQNFDSNDKPTFPLACQRHFWAALYFALTKGS